MVEEHRVVDVADPPQNLPKLLQIIRNFSACLQCVGRSWKPVGTKKLVDIEVGVGAMVVEVVVSGIVVLLTHCRGRRGRCNRGR